MRILIDENMRSFWLDGRPRDNGEPLWFMGGSWDNTTAAMIWRSDGINIAWPWQYPPLITS